MKRANSPTDKDVQRIAEVLFRNYGKAIRDETTFNKAYTAYFNDNLTDGIEGLRGEVFKEMRKRSPRIEEGSIFDEARGKDYDRDSKHTAQRVVQTRKEYTQLGARTVDLVGYDTKEAGERLSIKRGEFPLAGNVKGKPVFAREDTFVYKGKAYVRLRDTKGRFVKRI